MPAVNREISITYGSFSAGGSTDLLIDSYVKIDKSFDSASVEFDFVVYSETNSGFITACEDVEGNLREPFQDLLVTQDGTTMIDLSHSTNTGLNTQPSIVKQEDLASGRSRKYTCRIVCGLPADEGVSTTGIRDSSVNVNYSPARKRTVTISGVGTALDATLARAKYESQIGTFCGAILTALGGTFELTEEPTTTTDYNDKTIQFSRNYLEVIYSEAGSANDPAIVRQSFTISRNKIAPGDQTGSGAIRLTNLTASYDAFIDKDVTQDLKGKWEDTIKEWVYNQISSVFGSGSVAVVDTTPHFDYTENRISASVQILGADSGSTVLSASQTVEVNDISGEVLVAAWGDTPFTKYRYQGPSQRIKTITDTRRTLGASGLAAGGGMAAGGAGGNAVLNAFGGSNGNNPLNQGGTIGFGGANGAWIPTTGSNNPLANPMGGGIQFQFGGAGGAGGGAGDSSAGDGVGADSSGYVLQSKRVATTPLTIGRDGKTFDVTDTTTVTVMEYYVGVKGGNSVATGS